MKKTTYIFDTSALISDPHCFKSYKNSILLLPITVLDEVDKLKKQPNEAGRNARVVVKLLDVISESGNISEGVPYETNIVKIDIKDYDQIGNALYGDTRILSCASATFKKNKDVVLITNDINLRVRAKTLGIPAAAYEKDNKQINDLYTGFQCIEDIKLGEELKAKGVLSPKETGIKAAAHEYIIFVDKNGEEISKGRRVSENKIKLVKKMYPWGISPRNKEQECAIDLIMDHSLPLVTLVGNAGCGKSLMAIGSALELVLEQKRYGQFLIYRPIQAVGNDIGYTPGSISEKLAPWFQAVMDNLEVLFASSDGDKWKHAFEMFQKKGKIQFEAMTYIRGRSIPNSIVLVDEVQNISKEDIKTILTRVGENTKIILTGDISQIDNHYLDPLNNGLSYVVEKFKQSSLAGHITFTKGERSALATEASKIL